MLRHYRVTGIVDTPHNWPDSSILARERGRQLHHQIAQQWAGQGKYVEVPQAGLLVNKLGIPQSILIGTPDLYEFRPIIVKGKQTGFALHIVDHKTVSLKDKLYCKKEWWNQLLLYALLIIADNQASRPNFLIKKVVLGIWHYRRHLVAKESLLVVKHNTLPAFRVKEILTKANKYLSDYFKEEIRVVGIGALQVIPELRD